MYFKLRPARTKGLLKQDVLKQQVIAEADSVARIHAYCLGLTPRFAQVKLPLDPGVVLLDIGFTETDPNHGAQQACFRHLIIRFLVSGTCSGYQVSEYQTKLCLLLSRTHRHLSLM